MPDYDYLIIGGGMAADSAVRGIREVDEHGTIGLVSEELHPPYDRPPLSKGLWQGQDVTEIMRDTQELNAELHLGRRILALDRAERTALDQHGESYGYGKLLLATGGSPRRLPGADEGVIYLRNLVDYELLRAHTTQPRRVMVLGGGFIGAEITAALTQEGHSVQMAFPEFALLARLLPKELAEYLNDLYRQQGIRLHPGKNAASVERQADDSSLITFTDRHISRADVVVAGMGIIPEAGLAQSAGLTVSDGIEVDEFLRTSDPDIFAAGDVASIHSPALGVRRRVEHEENANLSGFFAGKAMAGAPEPYTHLPMFYTDLFQLGLEGVGLVDSRLETVTRWEEPYVKGAVWYLADGRLQGALMWNNWGQLDGVRAQIESAEPFSP